jgi:hypothetical protein
MNIAKVSLRFGLVAVFLVGATNVVNASPVEQISPAQKVFVPTGFDDNDISEIILKGEFRDSCYKIGRSEVKVDDDLKQVQIKAFVWRYTAHNCQDVVTPFIQPVQVGVLKKGDYKVIVNGGTPHEVRDYFEINEAINETPDDHLYAPVGSAQIVTDYPSDKQEVVLSGFYPLAIIGCYRMEGVRWYRNNTAILEMLPVMEFFEDDDPRCEEPNEFQESVKLTGSFFEDGLIHVRVMHGESLNSFVPFLR